MSAGNDFVTNGSHFGMLASQPSSEDFSLLVTFLLVTFSRLFRGPHLLGKAVFGRFSWPSSAWKAMFGRFSWPSSAWKS